MDTTVIALYDDLTTAQQAVEQLVSSGYDRKSISLLANDASNEYSQYLKAPAGSTTPTTKVDAVNAGQGASFGTVVGALTGALVGLGALAIPGIGPIIAAGPLAAAIGVLGSAAIGAGAGALTGGVTAALVKTGIPEERAGYYAEGIRRGGTLLVVHTDDAKSKAAEAILNNYKPVDIEERVAEWKKGNWTGFDANAKPYTSAELTNLRKSKPTTNLQGETVLPVIEEQLQVGKREVERGGVRVEKQVTEKPVSEQVHLRDEHITVERHPVDRPISAADKDAFKETTIELTEKGEEAVVAKTARVVEEVHVGKNVEDRVETIQDTVRRTDVKVEQTGGKTTTSPAAFDTYDTAFRSDFKTRYGANKDYSYDTYMPNYRYGYDLASNPQYANRDWASIESDARRQWETKNPGSAWEQFKDSIHYAWDKVRGVSTPNR